jgi:hypothetical protein
MRDLGHGSKWEFSINSDSLPHQDVLSDILCSCDLGVSNDGEPFMGESHGNARTGAWSMIATGIEYMLAMG